MAKYLLVEIKIQFLAKRLVQMIKDISKQEILLRKAKIITTQEVNLKKKPQGITEFLVKGSNKYIQIDFNKIPGQAKTIEPGKKVKIQDDGTLAIMRLGVEGHDPVLEMAQARKLDYSLLASLSKIPSELDSKVYFAKAKTPISHAEKLNIEAIYQVGKFTHFFFRSENKDKTEKYYSLKVDRAAPYRVTEENIIYSSTLKYLKSATSFSQFKEDKSNVYILWGTPYIREMNASEDLSNYNKKDMDKVFQVLIVAEDEAVEFLAPQLMIWKEYDETSFRKLVSNKTLE